MILAAVLLAALAGFLNGSYAFPLKHITRLQRDNVWLLFSIFTFLCMPWLALWCLHPHLGRLITLTPNPVIHYLVIGGVIFSAGMILFSIALKYTGIAIGFLLNLGTGAVIGSVLPLLLLSPQHGFTTTKLLETIGLVFFIIGILLAIQAAIARGKASGTDTEKRTKLGLILGVCSGLFTSSQGFVYAMALHQLIPLMKAQHISAITVANLPWAIFFNAVFIPYTLFFIIKSAKQKTLGELARPSSLKQVGYIVIMAILYFSCLVVFSKSTLLIGPLGEVVAWPLLLIFVILTSNFWGWYQGEWKHAGRTAKQLCWSSVVFMLLAIVTLSIEAYLAL